MKRSLTSTLDSSRAAKAAELAVQGQQSVHIQYNSATQGYCMCITVEECTVVSHPLAPSWESAHLLIDAVNNKNTTQYILYIVHKPSIHNIHTLCIMCELIHICTYLHGRASVVAELGLRVLVDEPIEEFDGCEVLQWITGVLDSLSL